MNLTAIIPPGQTEAVVNGLHQWDYGRGLEIRCSTLPATVEVHFGTAGSKETIVHVAASANGVATVSIPNSLLEQSSPIYAWVYLAEDTLGKTLLTVTLPIQARPRPAVAPAAIPAAIGDRYTEAVTAMNAAVESVRTGDVTVARATNADYATNANEANFATGAEYDKNGNKIHETYVTFQDAENYVTSEDARNYVTFQNEFTQYGASTVLTAGSYQFKVLITTLYFNVIIEADDGSENAVMLGTPGDGWDYMLSVRGGKPSIWAEKRGADTQGSPASVQAIYYRKIH